MTPAPAPGSEPRLLGRASSEQVDDDGGTAGLDPLRLDEQLCFALYSASNAVIRTYRPLLGALGLTYPQYIVLMALWERDDLTVTELAARLDLPVHGLSPVLDRLSRERLLERKPDPQDGRLRRLTLTDAGRALEQQAARAQAQVVEHSRFDAVRIERLRDELHVLTSQLQDAQEGPPPGDG